MKRLRLKGWVEDLIIFISLYVIMMLSSECYDFKLFVITRIIFLSMLIVNYLILKKYSKLFANKD